MAPLMQFFKNFFGNAFLLFAVAPVPEYVGVVHLGLTCLGHVFGACLHVANIRRRLEGSRKG